LTAAEPGNADWQRDLLISHVRLGQIGEDPYEHFSAALAIAVMLRDSDRLAPTDAWMIEALQSMVAQVKQGKAQ
jgi:hypothetical protein